MYLAHPKFKGQTSPFEINRLKLVAEPAGDGEAGWRGEGGDAGDVVRLRHAEQVERIESRQQCFVGLPIFGQELQHPAPFRPLRRAVGIAAQI